MDKEVAWTIRILLWLAVLGGGYYLIERQLDAERISDAKELLYGR